ncbi:helix-turn-helix domain-containing protein [soil metagenome]
MAPVSAKNSAGEEMPEEGTDNNRLTVAGLLDESLMAGARVVVGTDHVLTELHWVLPLAEVLSRTDPLDGIAVYTRPEAVLGNVGALTALAARGARTLLVDGAIPAEFLQAALPAGLVVVEMGFPVGFAALNRLLAERALNQEMHVMRYSTHVHASLAGLFHRGAGLQMLIREVSNLARNPAMALDARGHVVAHNGLGEDAVAVLGDTLGRLLAVGLPASRRTLGHDTRVQRVEGPNNSVWTAIASAIRLGKAFEGWVIVLAPGAQPGSHEMARHVVVTEQATAIIGSEMLRQHSVDEAEERARGDFVQALVHGSFSSEHDMRARAEYHEIDIDTRFGVFVAPGALPQGVDDPAASMVRLARYAAGVAPDPLVQSYVTVIGDVLVVVRSLRNIDDVRMRVEMTEYAEAMSGELRKRRGAAVAVAYGRPAHGAGEVSDSYREARVALGISRRLGQTGATSYQQLRSFTVLADTADTEHSRALVHDVLGPLRSSPDLLNTLDGYLANGGNVNATARVLNVHRNTMLTKLDRISRAIGLDIRQPENQFTVWLAIRLDMLSDVRAAVDREASFR